MNNYVDKQWKQRYNQSILENPIAKKAIPEDYRIREQKIREELNRIHKKSLLF